MVEILGPMVPPLGGFTWNVPFLILTLRIEIIFILFQMFKLIWQEEKIDLWVRPYKIICLSSDSGLIEPILNTVSLHQIKKNSNKSLKDYFIDEYGSDEDCDEFKQAQRNFMQSCAAYCLISYLMQVKDRYVMLTQNDCLAEDF
jgi:Phosphatidylinositol 3- and 4-kinase